MPELDPSMIPFAKMMGLTLVSAEKEKVIGEITVTPELCTTGRIMHGGAIMTVADTLGAIAAYLNIPESAKATTTIESKTNFMRAAPRGSHVTAECIPLHVGRRTSVWQTTLRNDEGKTIAIVTQSQLVLEK
jgi:1,4-dihydroxy-2-naphthoyl-CoA hydrolase